MIHLYRNERRVTEMKINVINKDLDFWTQQEIPVVKYGVMDDGEKELIYCNHAGAEEETVHNEVPRIDGPDIEWNSKVLVCGKCQAYKLDGDDYWQDAPFEGVHNER